MTNYNKRLDDVLSAVYLAGTENGLGRRLTDAEEIVYRKETFIKGNRASDEAKQALTSLIKELVAEAKRESHKSGYVQAIADFSGYYMDASIPAQRNLIMPHIAIELTENYKYRQNLLKAL